MAYSLVDEGGAQLWEVIKMRVIDSEETEHNPFSKQCLKIHQSHCSF